MCERTVFDRLEALNSPSPLWRVVTFEFQLRIAVHTVHATPSKQNEPYAPVSWFQIVKDAQNFFKTHPTTQPGQFSVFCFIVFSETQIIFLLITRIGIVNLYTYFCAQKQL